MARMPEVEGRVKQTQVSSIQQKYRYFLRKYHKLLEEHAHYRAIYEERDRSVEEHPQIQQENSSIAFIKKLMDETEKKHESLRREIDELRQEKDETMEKMGVLKGELMGLKREYFELERRRQQRRRVEDAIEEENKQMRITRNMFKIRLEKKQSLKQVRPAMGKGEGGSGGRAQGEVLGELEAINHIKEAFLERMGLSQEEYYKMAEGAYLAQIQSNVMLKHLPSRPFSRKEMVRRDQEEPLGGEETGQVLAKWKQEQESFMRLNGEGVLDLVLERGKVGEVLQLIESQKKQVVQAYRQFKHHLRT